MRWLRKLKALALMFRWQREYEAGLNRRVEVEQELFDAASGARPLPTQEDCKRLAIRLGTNQ